MHVQHSNPHTSTVGHRGHEWTALRDGIFNVPDDVGAELLAQPGWTRYYGEAAYEVPTGSTEPAAPAIGDWAEAGRAAAEQKLPRRVPDGLQPRSREARQFLAGYDEVMKADQAPGPAGEAPESPAADAAGATAG